MIKKISTVVLYLPRSFQVFLGNPWSCSVWYIQNLDIRMYWNSDCVIQKKEHRHILFFSKNEGVIFASQCFGGGVRTRDSSPPVYSLKTKLLQAVFRPSYAQSPTNDSIRLKVNHIGNILNYLKGNDGLGIYDKSLVDLGVVLGKQLLPFIDDRPSNFELINIDHYFMCRRETVVISLTVNLA